MISSELESRIVTLHFVEKWPVGTIAAQLNVHHSVVERVIAQVGLSRPKAKMRPTILDPFMPFIVETLAKYPRLCASRLYQMVQERGYTGGPDHFRHRLTSLRPSRPKEAFLRLKTLPGEQGQVDWAHFGKIRIGLAERALMAFVMVLSYSRRLFFRFFLDARMPSFLKGHEAALEAFGGCPKVLLYDNLKSAVLERRGDAIRFHPTLFAFAAHYHFEPRPVAPGRGNEKPRVERAIGYIRTAFFAARPFADLDDLNRQAEAFCEGPAAQRRWSEDPLLTISQAFAKEQSYLLPLPQNPFCTDESVVVHVRKTPYVRFDGNDYSVPHTAVQKTLTLLAGLDQIRIIDGNDVIATHQRSYDRRQQIEDPKHIEALVEYKRHAKHHRAMDRLAHLVPSSQDLLISIANRGGALGGTTLRLQKLLDEVGASELEAAILEAIEKNTPHLAAIHHILERRRFERGLPAKLPLHLPDTPKIKNLVVKPHLLATYDTLLQETSDETKNSPSR